MKARRATVRAIAAGFLALLACLCACTRQAAESTAQPKQSAATAVEKGPVRLSVRTDRSEAVVGERIARLRPSPNQAWKSPFRRLARNWVILK